MKIVVNRSDSVAEIIAIEGHVTIIEENGTFALRDREGTTHWFNKNGYYVGWGWLREEEK